MDVLVCVCAYLVSSSSSALVYPCLALIVISTPGTENQNKNNSSPRVSCSSDNLLGKFWTVSQASCQLYQSRVSNQTKQNILWPKLAIAIMLGEHLRQNLQCFCQVCFLNVRAISWRSSRYRNHRTRRRIFFIDAQLLTKIVALSSKKATSHVNIQN